MKNWIVLTDNRHYKISSASFGHAASFFGVAFGVAFGLDPRGPV